ncbi:2493_t:CDS:2 [Racocetra fulgida]|uniref:2493_t:CDS:1 n=1 Tax=Racocetra fulgida TaxID=60492 RepID=A0A9N8VYM3_9GLOM|nr:2493_t:CDS:2 [Racocetra fulgida]
MTTILKLQNVPKGNQEVDLEDLIDSYLEDLDIWNIKDNELNKRTNLKPDDYIYTKVNNSENDDDRKVICDETNEKIIEEFVTYLSKKKEEVELEKKTLEQLIEEKKKVNNSQGSCRSSGRLT